MNPPKLLIDENLPPNIAATLRQGLTRQEQRQRVRRALRLIAADAGGDMANKALRLAVEYGYAF